MTERKDCGHIICGEHCCMEEATCSENWKKLKKILISMDEDIAEINKDIVGLAESIIGMKKVMAHIIGAEAREDDGTPT